MIVGIDEVGRGPWAGPLVVGAAILGGAEIDGLTDSKKLTKAKRDALNGLILSQAVATGLGWVHAAELDEIGMKKALELACRRALEHISAPYHEIIIDGTVNLLAGTGKAEYVTTLKKADLLIPSVSAASIIAKVARDTWMEEQDELYPEYGFGSHVGYGTARHAKALELYGPTPLHRQSFKPIAAVTARSGTMGPQTAPATTKSIGDAGESVISEELSRRGYRLLERNWKTKFCEIDIVAEKDDCLYFVEVKHRKNEVQGGGIAALTPKKLTQMTFAARVFMNQTKYQASTGRLMAATTTGNPARLQSLIVID